MSVVQDISEFNNWIKEQQNAKFFFLVDENTHEYCLAPLISELPDLAEYEILEVEPGEETKSIEVAANLWLSLTELGAERKDVIINVGGGVVTDLGGFVASTYKRGIAFVNVPTSLLAMVDAAQGGKTGIDLAGAKNLVGTFAHADLVYTDSFFLETLPENHKKSGFAEMLKHGLIANKNHWEEALKKYPEIDDALILQSSEIKMGIVAKDPKEKGERKLLNFGHTVGHALESYLLKQGVPVLHGEAIAAGMIIESELSVTYSDLSRESNLQIQKSIDSIFDRLPIDIKNIEAVLEWLKFDKKNEDGNLKFSLLAEIGNGVYDKEISIEEVKTAIENYLA